MKMPRFSLKQLALASFCSLSFSSASFATTVMHVASWLPPTHTQNAVVLPTWGKWIEEATEGRVKVEIDYSHGNPKGYYDLVQDGVVEASWSLNDYVPGRFKLTEVAELPGINADAEASSVAYWKVYNKYFLKKNEFDGLELVGLFTHGPGNIHLTQPISDLSQLQGKKIRVGGGIAAQMGEKLGVTGVSAPATKVYELLQQGVVDGVFIAMLDQKVLRLNEVTKQVINLPGGLFRGGFSVFINPDFLDSLDPKDKQAILAVSGEKLSAMAGRAWDEADKEGMKTALASGIQVINVKPGDAMDKEFEAIRQPVEQQWLASVKGEGVDASAALDEFKQLATDYQPAQ